MCILPFSKCHYKVWNCTVISSLSSCSCSIYIHFVKCMLFVLCPLPGWLQSSDCVLPVLYNGQLLLAAGGRPLSSRIVGGLFLLREEVLLGLHPDRLGWEWLPFMTLYVSAVLGARPQLKANYGLCDPCRWDAIITLAHTFISFFMSLGGPTVFITAWSVAKAYYNDVG